MSSSNQHNSSWTEEQLDYFPPSPPIHSSKNHKIEDFMHSLDQCLAESLKNKSLEYQFDFEQEIPIDQNQEQKKTLNQTNNNYVWDSINKRNVPQTPMIKTQYIDQNSFQTPFRYLTDRQKHAQNSSQSETISQTYRNNRLSALQHQNKFRNCVNEPNSINQLAQPKLNNPIKLPQNVRQNLINAINFNKRTCDGNNC
ncbi:UNKNOWN [Stylonychia lemnae]|uniref:Uncharacterized protein n=1 Tax=Stylonychia lemnae TaxID=5949 RepID=A0A078B586_STYLE|nr:UNKNOWN [Stylonychia lemnae]|eukprot:CDW89589.1 UNKNOWN [Stylonychia lemnae]